MERRLHLVTAAESPQTLRILAGEQHDDDAADCFLQKRLGNMAVFISATSLYEIDTVNDVATFLNNVEGGLLARYEGLCRLPVIQGEDIRNYLAPVTDNSETLARFSTINADISSIRRLRQRTISIGSQLPTVGFTLDQPIEVESLQAILRSPAEADAGMPHLRLIK